MINANMVDQTTRKTRGDISHGVGVQKVELFSFEVDCLGPDCLIEINYEWGVPAVTPSQSQQVCEPVFVDVTMTTKWCCFHWSAQSQGVASQSDSVVVPVER